MSLERLTQIGESELDRFTGSKKVIDSDHAYIHDGLFYTVAQRATLATGATAKFTFLTPAAGYIHYRPVNIATSADKLTVNFYEGSSGNSGGSALTPVNRNRNSNRATGVVFKSGVTVTTNGTKFSEAYIAGATGTGGTRTGAQLSASNEWVLKPSTIYTWEYINGSSGDNVVFSEFQWYEEVNG